MRLTPTASQTVGPFFCIGLDHLCARPMSSDEKEMTVHGRVLDANHQPVPDAMLELWYADSAGHYPVDSVGTNLAGRAAGFARVITDDEGRFSFTLPRPGAVPYDSTRMQAPHITVCCFARGLLRHLMTRMYFPDEDANAVDPVLQSLPEDRRATLVAHKESPSVDTLEWNIVLQGEDETVFFAC
jgi:protocatechuate 3,4-dioxygenase, alpha subunit